MLAVYRSFKQRGQLMEGTDALSTLAEVTIGIASFSAITLVLSRGRDSLSPDILLLIRTVIVNGMFIAFLALFPRILASRPLTPAEVWRWSGGAFVFGVLFVLSRTLARILRPWNCIRLPHLRPISMSSTLGVKDIELRPSNPDSLTDYRYHGIAGSEHEYVKT